MDAYALLLYILRYTLIYLTLKVTLSCTGLNIEHTVCYETGYIYICDRLCINHLFHRI